MVPQEIDL
jgi:hypothetical protein